MPGRHPKRSVDWFPHDGHASDGKTITILENYFGIEGYGVWFKILERLSTTNNHFLDCRNSDDLEFLAAKYKIPCERLLAILDKLAFLEAIDKPLWSHRIIWCQNLVDNLKPAYDNRRQTVPEKPQIGEIPTPKPPKDTTVEKDASTPNVEQPTHNLHLVYNHPTPCLQPSYNPPTDDNTIPIPVNGENDCSNATERVEVVERGSRESRGISTTGNSDIDIFRLFEQNIGMLTPLIAEDLKDAETQYPRAWIEAAMKEATRKGVHNWKYCLTILERWKAQGFDGHKKPPAIETPDERRKRIQEMRRTGPIG